MLYCGIQYYVFDLDLCPRKEMLKLFVMEAIVINVFIKVVFSCYMRRKFISDFGFDESKYISVPFIAIQRRKKPLKEPDDNDNTEWEEPEEKFEKFEIVERCRGCNVLLGKYEVREAEDKTLKFYDVTNRKSDQEDDEDFDVCDRKDHFSSWEEQKYDFSAWTDRKINLAETDKKCDSVKIDLSGWTFPKFDPSLWKGPKFEPLEWTISKFDPPGIKIRKLDPSKHKISKLNIWDFIKYYVTAEKTKKTDPTKKPIKKDEVLIGLAYSPIDGFKQVIIDTSTNKVYPYEEDQPKDFNV